MGIQEKEREEHFWKIFSETGKMPELPLEFATPEKVEYALSILHEPYNQLTKVLFGEALARSGLLPESEWNTVGEAAEWIPKIIFSQKRNYVHREEMGKAFTAFQRASACPCLKKMAAIDDAYQLAWGWVSSARTVYKGLPDSSSSVDELINTLRQIAQSGAWAKIDADERLRGTMLFWMTKIMSKDSNGRHGLTFVKIFKFDGLQNLPETCWERKQKLIHSDGQTGPDHFPATAEEMAKNIYRVFKALTSKRDDSLLLDKECLIWAISFLDTVHEKFPDDEWADFRIGKMLIWCGDAQSAKARILPTVLRKQTEFWAWDLMGDLFPEHKKNCVARALLCKADEKYTSNLKREATALGLDILDKEALRHLADEAEDLLLEGIEPVRGILIARYKNNEGKSRIRFKSETSPDPMPVSPMAIRFPKELANGTPVWLYRDVTDVNRLIAAKIRNDGEQWDLLPCDTVTFYRLSRKGKYLFVSENTEYSSDETPFSTLGKISIGDVFDIRYTVRMKDTLEIRTICHAKRRMGQSPLIHQYEGAIHFLSGGQTAFAEDAYLRDTFVTKLQNEGCVEGSPISGLAVRFPERYETDNRGRKRLRRRCEAITAEMLKGEALERYRYEHGLS